MAMNKTPENKATLHKASDEVKGYMIPSCGTEAAFLSTENETPIRKENMLQNIIMNLKKSYEAEKG